MAFGQTAQHQHGWLVELISMVLRFRPGVNNLSHHASFPLINQTTNTRTNSLSQASPNAIQDVHATRDYCYHMDRGINLVFINISLLFLASYEHNTEEPISVVARTNAYLNELGFLASASPSTLRGRTDHMQMQESMDIPRSGTGRTCKRHC